MLVEKFFFSQRDWSYGNGNNGHMYGVQVHTIQAELLIKLSTLLCIVTKMTRDDHDGYYL